MKKSSFIWLIIGVSVLLMSSGAGAISVGLVDGNHDNEVILDIRSLAPGYRFGYIDGNGFHNLASGIRGRATQDFIGVSVVNFALQALSNPASIFDAGAVIFHGQTAANVYHTAILEFANMPLGVTVATARNSPPDGLALAPLHTPVTPNPEPATWLLLSSMMGVGYGALHKKLRNREGSRAA